MLSIVSARFEILHHSQSRILSCAMSSTIHNFWKTSFASCARERDRHGPVLIFIFFKLPSVRRNKLHKWCSNSILIEREISTGGAEQIHKCHDIFIMFTIFSITARQIGRIDKCIEQRIWFIFARKDGKHIWRSESSLWTTKEYPNDHVHMKSQKDAFPSTQRWFAYKRTKRPKRPKIGLPSNSNESSFAQAIFIRPITPKDFFFI